MRAELNSEQLAYLLRNEIDMPSDEELELIYEAGQLNRQAITRIYQRGYLWVELAELTGRTVRELQNA